MPHFSSEISPDWPEGAVNHVMTSPGVGLITYKLISLFDFYTSDVSFPSYFKRSRFMCDCAYLKAQKITTI